MSETRNNCESIFERCPRNSVNILLQKKVAIAGCGGLGSNAAVALTRSGIGSLILVDFDLVEPSNLNRQYFFLTDVGKTKSESLAKHLKNINPKIKITIINKKLQKNDVANSFKDADLLIEAFDDANSKKWLLDEWCKLFPENPIIMGNGISGIGKTDYLVIRNIGNVWFCGDQTSDISEGLSAPRVAIVANMQANIALEILLNKK